MIEVLTGRLQPWQPPTGYEAVELDLGCGKGGFLRDLAERYPQRLVVGLDVMLGRLRKVDRKLTRQALTNTALLRADAWELIGWLLPDACLDRVHILCPDPWPKARHRGHRLVTSEFIGRVRAKLRPGGILHLATDNQPYFETMQSVISRSGAVLTPEAIADIADLATDFERDFTAIGRPVQHLAAAV